jgi:hypothetical protein
MLDAGNLRAGRHFDQSRRAVGARRRQPAAARGARPSAGQQRCFIEQERSLDEPDLSWCLRLDHPLA